MNYYLLGITKSTDVYEEYLIVDEVEMLELIENLPDELTYTCALLSPIAKVIIEGYLGDNFGYKILGD
jgi:hypothetical protein